MKFLVIFLSIYTFYLASAPCVDDSLHLGAESCQTACGDQDSHADHSDACSPFCICSCCSVPVTIAPIAMISQPFFSCQTAFTPVSSNLVSSFSVTFWQPPKLS